MQKINKSFKVANHQQFHILKQYETPLSVTHFSNQARQISKLIKKISNELTSKMLHFLYPIPKF